MFWRRHPFAVTAHFERVVALSFAFPEDVLRPLVPAGLEVDAFEGFGFLTVALVWTRDLRPAGFPALFGQDFFLGGYRIFTRLQDEKGRKLRGLKILRSETDKRRMVWMGNLLTCYHYRHITVKMDSHGSKTHLETKQADGGVTLDLTFDLQPEQVKLPAGSPFANWSAARRFAGPMPFTFSPEADGVFLMIEGSRQNWVPRPIELKAWKVSLFDEEPFQGTEPVLANAFTTENVSYQWKKGRLVRAGALL